MTQGCTGKNISGFFSQKFYTVLLAALVLVMGMVTGRVEAVESVDKVPSKVQGAQGVNFIVNLKNVDLKAYAKYNAEIQNCINLHNMVLGKADPGTTIVISTSPVEKANIFESGVELSTSKIAKNFPDIPGTEKKFRQHGNVVSVSYVIPKDAEMVCGYAVLTYDGLTDANGKYWTVVGGDRNYYIFTSDEAFKKAYKMCTGKTLTGPISSSATAKKETKETTTKKPTDKDANNKANVNQPAENSGNERNSDSDEEEDLPDSDAGKFAVGVGTAAVGALLGGAGAAGGVGGSGDSGEGEEEPEIFVYKDPATGAESLYVRDPETGEWYDPSTNSIMNPDDLERFNKQRMEDQKWTRDQTDKLRNRNTELDRQLKADRENLMKKYDEIDRQGAKDKAAIRSGTYGMSDEQRKEYLNKRQENYVTKQTAAHRTADNWDTAVKVAEGVETAADIGVDVLSKITAPVGGEAIADAYVMTKNVVKSTSEAVAEGKNVLIGIRKGLGDGAIDVAQNHAKGVGQVLANVGGEAIKGGVEAAWKGESITQGAFEGSLKGTVKLGIERVGDAISNKLNNSVKDSWQKAKDHAETITNSYSPHISRKSTDALHKMNLDKYTDYLKKAGKLDNANTIGNAVIKNTLPDAFDDDD